MLRKNIEEMYAYIIPSKLRSGILEVLYMNATLRQTEIAKKLKQKQQNISRAIYGLEKTELIECLNPDKLAWKSYMITELGKEVVEFGMKLKAKAKKRLQNKQK
ncbi:MAG: MarR family transcriptional regulator [Nanoarchaeota archaeon]|nr:MarR family transcriptional regulator [Nanoarchaeota archaeon]